MLIEISLHARNSMRKHAINEDEVMAALVDGNVEFEIFVRKEKRYGSVLIEKHRKIIVIWTYRGQNKRVVTSYPLNREI